ncbi:MAG TPA: HEAT repeat domain-containing protein [Propionicimonas sp.]
MGSRQEYRRVLRALPECEWATFLDATSGLPGPRGNLELIQAAADEGNAGWFSELATSADEFRAATGAVGLGRLLADAPDAAVTARLKALAADPRWRVREGVAMALQRLGDADPERLWPLVRGWVLDPDPLVQRAAVAGACEPRLLRPAGAAAVALEVCGTATTTLAARPPGERRSDGVRSLRQALGYCWSVAVAADPGAGVARFQELAGDPDPDVRWIVRENGRKARLVQALNRAGSS